jgi:hypothetical protein
VLQVLRTALNEPRGFLCEFQYADRIVHLGPYSSGDKSI